MNGSNGNKTSKNFLKRSEVIALVEWTRKHITPDLRITGPACQRLAALAAVELKFDVTESNIRSMLSDMGVPRGVSDDPNVITNRQLLFYMKELAAFQVAIAGQLDIEVPKTISDFAAGSRGQDLFSSANARPA